MHSALNRIQGVFGFFTTVAFVLGLLAAVSVVLQPGAPTSSVELKNVQVVKGRPHYYSRKREEYAQIKFDLDADLSSLFNWNTKQLFVYVLASYPSSTKTSSDTRTPPNATVESVIWDTIIPAPESPYSFSALQERFLPSKTSNTRSKSKSKSSKSKTNNKNKKQPSETPTPGVLKLRNQKPKYQITDITGKIAERENVELVVGWNVQPWIGLLQWNPGSNIASNLPGGLFGLSFVTGGSSGRSKPFAFPALKSKESEKKV